MTALAAVKELDRVIGTLSSDGEMNPGMLPGMKGVSQVALGALEPLTSAALQKAQDQKKISGPKSQTKSCPDGPARE